MPKGGPRKSNASTPLPGESDTPNLPTTADRLSFADYPRPFRNPHFASRLHLRVASSTTAAKKNAKQILTLERERYAGGDGFLSAYQTGQKARGEPIDVGSKKRKGPPGVGPTGEKAKRGDNLRGRGKKAAAAAAAAAGGTETPGGTEGGGSASGRGTPVPGYADGEEDDDEEGDEGEAKRLEGLGIGGSTGTRGGKEIITYHTPTAPPSLLPTRKYCDITGLHAQYTDPRTKLRYKGLEVWHVVRGLGPGGDQAYLSLRGAQTSLK